nr:ribonuclease H-like domain-containing protein [Tanacetum cinerariifolium]
MDLFGPTFFKSLNKKNYCLVITDDYSRFTWVFFLATKDETSLTLKNFITGLENQLSLKVKVIRSDNGTEFKNSDLNQFCGIKGIKREFSVPRTPQQNGTSPTWLFYIDSLTKTMNYQPVTTRNQTNPSTVFQDTFDADKAGKEANLQYVLFSVWSTGFSNPQNKKGDTAFAEKEHDAEKPKSTVNLSPSRSALSGKKDISNDVSAASPIVSTVGQNYSNNTNPISDVDPIVNTSRNNYSNSTNLISAVGPSNSNSSPTHGQSLLRDTYQPMVDKEDIDYYDHENVGAEADFNNLESSIIVSPILTTRIYNAHPISQIIGENLALWSDKLEDALWAFRTAFKTSVSCTPYRLVYGKKKKLHDEKIKNRIFNVGDQVLLFNFRLKIFSGKLKSRWSGPFTISEIYPYGTAKLVHPDGCNFKVNCHRLKHYHGGDPPPLEIPDVQTFSKDN